jgi:hypothetical protein
MIQLKDISKALECLQGIVNQAAHPDIAIRVVMVDLKPIRKEIARLKALMGVEVLPPLGEPTAPLEQPLSITGLENDGG